MRVRRHPFDAVSWIQRKKLNSWFKVASEQISTEAGS
jgi:hypothetical protein